MQRSSDTCNTCRVSAVYDARAGGGDATDLLKAALASQLTTPALVALASSCHAFWDGPFSRTQATENEVATQVIADCVEARRAERLRILDDKLGPHGPVVLALGLTATGRACPR